MLIVDNLVIYYKVNVEYLGFYEIYCVNFVNGEFE